MIDFALDDTQRQIVDTAREFGREVLEPAEREVDGISDPATAYASPAFRGTMAKAYELGFQKMALPETIGGMGLDANTMGLVWEELARSGPGFAATLMSAVVVPRLIAFMAPGNTELFEKYVAPFAEDETGEWISAWGSSEPEVGSDGSNYYDPKVHHYTTAVKKEDRWVINGTKSDFISNGGLAKVYVVFACVDASQGIKGSGAFIIPADAPGVTKGKPLDKVGLRVLNQSPIFFEDVEIPESYLIFPPGEGYPMLHNSIVTVGNIGVGYLAVGIMRAAYEEALEHAKTRIQWGKPILEHQLIEKKLFDIFTAIEAARALLWKASWHSRTQFPGDLKTSLAAKIFSSDMAMHHTAEMVQILGGYGISREYAPEKHMRDAKLLQIMDGANDTLRGKAARAMWHD